jgi:hypothetical protein
VRRRAKRNRRQQAILVPLETLRESKAPHVSEPSTSGDARYSEIDLPELPLLQHMLRMRAADDSQALQLLVLCERGKLRRRHALQLGMSAAEYRAARRRLMRLTSEVLAVTPGTPAEHPMDRSAVEGMPATQPENKVCQSADPMSAIGLLLAPTRFGPRRAEASGTIEDRDRRSA